MHSIFRLKTLQLGFHFYKRLLVLSLLISLMFGFMKMSLAVILVFKFLLFVILLIAYFEPSLKQKLIFYKNFGMSAVFLIFTSFVIDSFFTSILILTLHQF